MKRIKRVTTLLLVFVFLLTAFVPVQAETTEKRKISSLGDVNWGDDGYGPQGSCDVSVTVIGEGEIEAYYYRTNNYIQTVTSSAIIQLNDESSNDLYFEAYETSPDYEFAYWEITPYSAINVYDYNDNMLYGDLNEKVIVSNNTRVYIWNYRDGNLRADVKAIYKPVDKYAVLAITEPMQTDFYNENDEYELIATFSGTGLYTKGESYLVTIQDIHDGYEFIGWNDGTTSSAITGSNTKVINLTAFFEKKEVTLYAYEDDSIPPSELTYYYGDDVYYSDISLPINGKVFDHWEFADGTLVPYVFQITGDTNIYAVYSELPKYTLSILPPVGNGEIEVSYIDSELGPNPIDVTVTDSALVIEDYSITANITASAFGDFYFHHWNVTISYDGYSITFPDSDSNLNISNLSGANYEFEAVFIRQDQVVLFKELYNLVSGEYVVEDIILERGITGAAVDVDVHLNAPEESNFYFDGWYGYHTGIINKDFVIQEDTWVGGALLPALIIDVNVEGIGSIESEEQLDIPDNLSMDNPQTITSSEQFIYPLWYNFTYDYYGNYEYIMDHYLFEYRDFLAVPTSSDYDFIQWEVEGYPFDYYEYDSDEYYNLVDAASSTSSAICLRFINDYLDDGPYGSESQITIPAYSDATSYGDIFYVSDRPYFEDVNYEPEHINVTAVFEDEEPTPPTPKPKKYTLTVTSDEGGSSNFEGFNTFTSGTIVDLEITVEAGFYFVGWSGDTNILNEDEDAVMYEDASLHAEFALIEEEPEPEEPEEEEDNSEGANSGEEEILDGSLPVGSPEEPETGGIPIALFGITGATLLGTGLFIKRKRNK